MVTSKPEASLRSFLDALVEKERDFDLRKELQIALQNRDIPEEEQQEKLLRVYLDQARSYLSMRGQMALPLAFPLEPANQRNCKFRGRGRMRRRDYDRIINYRNRQIVFLREKNLLIHDDCVERWDEAAPVVEVGLKEEELPGGLVSIRPVQLVMLDALFGEGGNEEEDAEEPEKPEKSE